MDCPAEGNCSDLGVDYFCCPDAVNADMDGCANLTIGKEENESCTCPPECDTGLVCNGPAEDKHCCPAGKIWNGSECKLGGQVLIVALKSNLRSTYSDSQLTTMENRINDYINSLGTDGLGGSFFYLDEDETSNVIGKKTPANPGYSDVDGIIELLIAKFKSEYVIIVGGFDHFPFAVVGGEYTDDSYGDYGTKDDLPEIPVGRVPDPNDDAGNGMDMILNSFDTFIRLHNTGGVDISDYVNIIMPRSWNSGVCFSEVYGQSCSSNSRCLIQKDVETAQCRLPQANGKQFVMVLLHGDDGGYTGQQMFSCNSGWECSCAGWSGANSFIWSTMSSPSYDVSDSVWMSMSCLGGAIERHDTVSKSIIMTFFDDGGASWVGATNNNLGSHSPGCPVKGGDGVVGSLFYEIVDAFASDKRIGDSYLEGKIEYSTNPAYANPSNGYILHINNFYGDPTLKIKSMW